MPQQDPLEELFHRSAKNAELRPGLKAWHRLEQRLDTPTLGRKPLRRTQGFFKPWYYAAAAVILVMIIMIGLQGQQAAAKAATLAQVPESVEELNTEVSPTKQISDYTSVPEGSRRDFLTVRNSTLPQLTPADQYRL